MSPYLTTERAVLYHAAAEEVYPTLPDGSVSMVWSDGPYGLAKDTWDRMGVDGLADWYAPHIEAWGRVCAPSATVYLWGTAEGWARLDPVMRAAGWRFGVLVTWVKPDGAAMKATYDGGSRAWPDVTEVCGFYQRNAWEIDTCAGEQIAHAAGRDDRNWIRHFLASEWAATGLTRKAADDALGTNGIAGHYFGRSQWMLPTWESFATLAQVASEYGPPRDRPYLVHPAVWPSGDLRASYDHLRAEYDHLRAEYDHLRGEYEAARVPFFCPNGVSNVWRHPQVGGKERLQIDGESHPCQKPLLFADRAIRASTRVGDLVLEPFAGTNRCAVAVHRMPPEEARRVVSAEIHRPYLDAVRPSLVCDPAAGLPANQAPLFGV